MAKIATWKARWQDQPHTRAFKAAWERGEANALRIDFNSAVFGQFAVSGAMEFHNPDFRSRRVSRS